MVSFYSAPVEHVDALGSLRLQCSVILCYLIGLRLNVVHDDIETSMISVSHSVRCSLTVGPPAVIAFHVQSFMTMNLCTCIMYSSIQFRYKTKK